ncbi:MAG: 2-dehydropantoate 2-reductase [Deltaproteobacteria bacterium]|nr:2-dehydropantoate 2-reductase [Deltaproteobacteria bacterium]
MDITIIGAGAMGSLFGSLLAQSGENVFLMDIWKDHVSAINSQGLAVEFDGKTSRVDIPASSNMQDTRESDLVIIFVKSTQTKQAAVQALKCLNNKGVVLTLQNGMGNADKIAQVVHPDKVIAGTTSHGATMLGPGLIRHAGTGPTLIGMWSGKNNAGLENIKNVFCNAGIDTKIEDNIHLIIWKKLIINVGINAITALTGIKNGRILDSPPTGELVRTAVKEACDVALAHGVKLQDDIAEQVFDVAKATGPNRSSMGQDADHKRLTEIDAINGAIVSLAQKKGIHVPVNQTLTALVQTLQENYNPEYQTGQKK